MGIKKNKFLLWLFVLLSTFSNSQTFSNATQFNIYDTSTVCVPVIVSGLPSSINSSFGLTSLCLNISFSKNSHLTIQLQSPDGTMMTMISGVGGSGQNFSTTCLAMNGGTHIANGNAPFNGIYIPQMSLNIFNNGQNPNGLWKFCISNTFFGDNGFFQNGSITFSANPPIDPPPPPVTCTFCTCSNGTGSCDLLPDMTASSLCIQQHKMEQPGKLFMANATPNIGRGPIEIHAIDSCYCNGVSVPCTSTCMIGIPLKKTITQRVYRKNGPGALQSYDRIAGKMSFHSGHHHLHVDDWASFSLRIPIAGESPDKWPITGSSVKQSFCLVNTGNCNLNPGYCKDANGNTLMMADIPNAGFGLYTGCGYDQGIYPGYLDQYDEFQNTPIDLSGICNGTYSIVSITDPKNNFVESDETNNAAVVPITLTKQSAATSTASFNYTVNSQDVNFVNTSPSNSKFIWEFGDGKWDTVPSPLHSYLNAGTYTISLMSVNRCFSKITQTITVKGSEVFSSDHMNLQLHGNPIAETSYISYYSSNGEGVELIVYDLAGRMISELKYDPVKAGVQKINLPIEVKNLTEGIYMMKLIDAGKRFEILKFGR